MYNKNKSEEVEQPRHRVNHQIRVPSVRVVKDGTQMGIMATDKARGMAQDSDLDLVEIVPNAKPPVCAIMDYGRFKFEQKLKDKERLKKQRENQIKLKVLVIKPVTSDHDLATKLNQAKEFLTDGKKVQFTIAFKGRHLAHKERGTELVNRIIADLAEVGSVECPPAMESNNLICRLQPKGI